MSKFFSFLMLIPFFLYPIQVHSQGPAGKDFGFGIIIGDPLGATCKYWLDRTHAVAADIGSSYFGTPRIDIDYLWHFNAFHSSYLSLYAGPGLVVGFGEGRNIWYKRGDDHFRPDHSGSAFAVRGLIGIDFVPKRSSFDIFLQMGPLIGISSGGTAFDAALGVRYYP